MKITRSPKRAANLLKRIVNSYCVDGFTWYENVGEMPTMFDICRAIDILEASEDETLYIVDDETEE